MGAKTVGLFKKLIIDYLDPRRHYGESAGLGLEAFGHGQGQARLAAREGGVVF
jgi:hypothetical protein